MKKERKSLGWHTTLSLTKKNMHTKKLLSQLGYNIMVVTSCLLCLITLTERSGVNLHIPWGIYIMAYPLGVLCCMLSVKIAVSTHAFMSGRLSLNAGASDGRSSYSWSKSQAMKAVHVDCWMLLTVDCWRLLIVDCWRPSAAIMGVHGLWQLLHPAGKPVSPASLEGKVLAVGILLQCL